MFAAYVCCFGALTTANPTYKPFSRPLSIKGAKGDLLYTATASSITLFIILFGLWFIRITNWYLYFPLIIIPVIISFITFKYIPNKFRDSIWSPILTILCLIIIYLSAIYTD